LDGFLKMKVYKSKIDLEFVIPLNILIGSILILTLYEEANWIAFIINILIILFIFHMTTSTFYIINRDVLTIKCGILYSKSIEIKSIKRIIETNNPISSPALSLDRLQIKYGQYHSVIISPKHKEEFINQITNFNSNIIIIRKKSRIKR